MKSLISVVCALLLIGCSNDSVPSEATPPPAEATTIPASAETTTDNNTTLPEPIAPTSVVPTTPIPAGETAQTVTPKAPVATSIDGGALYSQKCASCHGTKGEKAALNKSLIIAQFSEAQVKEALKGYQAGTYGKDMKALMQGQAKALDDAQIDALAKHISNL